MRLWVWAFILCIVFLITYDKRTGRLDNFFAQELVEVPGNGQLHKREAQSGSDTDEPN
jgi:hypothetical protein